MNLREQKFCLEYLKDGIGEQAAIRAGYSKKTARQKATNLFTKIYIQEEITRLRK